MKLKSPAEVAEFAKNNPLCAIKMYADWCGPCRMLNPHWSKFQQENSHFSFAEINVEEFKGESKEEMEWFKERAPTIPSVLFYVDGEFKSALKNPKTLDDLSKAALSVEAS